MAANILKTFRKQLSKFKRRLVLSSKRTDQVFAEIYLNNSWGDAESLSGPGSRLERTDKIRLVLPALLKKYGCLSLLDIPCGDFNWMKTLELEIDYIGGDIVSELIKRNQEKFTNEHRKFINLDLLSDRLPKMDLVLCRDCLVHFSSSDAITALKNIKGSRSKYLLTTTFPERGKNRNIVTGEWHPINLSIDPYNFPPPCEFIDDAYDFPDYYDKHLGLWRISDLPDF
jgi:hypothetical protein